MRVVVDTNVWISAAIRPRGFAFQVCEALANNVFEAVVSEQLMAELAEVIWRPRLRQRYGLTIENLVTILELASERTTRIPDPPVVPLSRDPKDDIFVCGRRGLPC